MRHRIGTFFAHFFLLFALFLTHLKKARQKTVINSMFGKFIIFSFLFLWLFDCFSQDSLYFTYFLYVYLITLFDDSQLIERRKIFIY